MEALASAVMRHAWHQGRETRVTTDASLVGLGVILEQQEEETGNGYRWNFWSKKLSPREQRYHATDREWMACVFSVSQAWPHFLRGKEFVLRTDHAALGGLLRSTRANLSDRQVRWVEKLQPYHFRVEHLKGVTNRAADALSRTPTFFAAAVEITPYPTTFSLGEIRQKAAEDKGYQEQLQRVRGARNGSQGEQRVLGA